MKTKIIFFIIILCTGAFSCDTEEPIQDPIYEFVSFAGDAGVTLNESTNETEGFPLVVQLWAFDPYSEDLDLTIDVTGTNVTEGVDFTVTPDSNVKLRAGSLTSDTIWIKTINNDVPNDLERSFNVSIETVSKSDIYIGLGISEPKNETVTFTIADDECSGSAICVFNTTLSNTISEDGNFRNELPAVASVNKVASEITLTGDLMDYSTFPDAKLIVTLTPGPVPTQGTASFGEQETGTDGDGYAYKFVQTGAGTYDTVTGKIKISYDIYYEDGGWWYWYSVANEFTVP